MTAAATDRTGRSSHGLKGIAFLYFGVAIFTLQDAIIKFISADYPVAEALTIRSVVAYGPLLLFLLFDGGLAALNCAHKGWVILRAACLFTAYTAYYLALAALPMSTMAAPFFSAPLFIVALSGPLLGERAGLGRWLAVLVGFAGALIVTRPDAADFEPAALLALASALAYGTAQRLARRHAAAVTTTAMAVYQNRGNLAGALAIGLLFRSGAWADQGRVSLDFLLRA
jgi:drug/metabolite transporter (DMT)-like permease